MKILILYTLPPDATDPARTRDEFDLSAGITGLQQVLPEAVAVGVRGEPREILNILDKHHPDVIFNAAEAPLGRPEFEAHIAALLEWAGIPFTGSRAETLTLCRRKDWTAAVLSAAGVPIPRRNHFPCIVKPADQDGSAGVSEESICETPAQAADAAAKLHGPALIEEFLPGDEFCVSLWGRREPEFFSFGRTRFTPKFRLYSYTAKWDTDSDAFAALGPTYGDPIDPALLSQLADTAKAAWRAVGIRGYVRIDLRQDSAGIPRVMDINPNPELSPHVSIARAAREIGWSWERFVRQQLEWALDG